MAIALTEPQEHLEEVVSVLVYSDAPTNDDAIRDIDTWAREHGFVRTHEYNLRTTARNGKRVYMGFCYRLRDEDYDSIEEGMRRVNERREKMPMTTDSAELLR